MNGELAEVICLATHGTSWLSGVASDAPDLERTNSTFQFVGSVGFHLTKRSRLSRDERVTGVAEWLRGRRRAEVERLSIIIPGISATGDQHARAAFAIAGRWGLLSTAI